MSAIDFTEIPQANLGTGKQDAFELFGQDFLHSLGYEIEEGPSRGPDGGKDLIIQEPLSGILTREQKRWIVSCKHYAHSGRAVGDRDEPDILGRVSKFDAEGFIALYSTVPSSGLMNTFKYHEAKIDIQVLDAGVLEKMLVSEASLQGVFKRYFPESFQAWHNEARTPTEVWDSYTPLNCIVCGKDLLSDLSGLVADVVDKNQVQVWDVYWACHGDCDRKMDKEAWETKGAITRWESMKDLAIPFLYIRWIMAHFNRLRDGLDEYTDEAFDHFLHFTTCMAQVVVKETTPEQWARLEDYADIPSFLGGFAE